MLNYEGMAYSYGAPSFAEIATMVPGDALSRTGSFAIDARNELATRPAVAVILSSFYRVALPSTIDAAYPYMAALSVLVWFPLTFLQASCFGAGIGLAAIVAFCAVVGFFGQYVIDINAWGQLAGMPLGIATLGLFVAYATDRAQPTWASRIGAGAAVAILVGGMLYLYPEVTPVYAVAIVTAALAALAVRRFAAIDPLTTMAVGAAGGVGLCLPFLSGTIGSLVRQTGGAVAAESRADFFDAYIYAVPFKAAVGAGQRLADAVYAVDGLLGIYFTFPHDLSPSLTAMALVGEAAFAVALALCCALAIAKVRRRQASAAGVAATLGALAVGVGLYAAGRPWEAGKAFSMAAPLWLALLALPMFVLRGWALALILPAVALLTLHLTFGGARLAVAARIDGIGRHAPYPAMASTKRSYLVDIGAWRRGLAGCRGVSVDVDDRVLDRMAQVFLAQQPVPWSAPEDLRGSFTYNEPIGRMQQVADPDCRITDRKSSDGLKIVNLRRPPEAAGTMTYAGGTVDIVDSDRDGVDVSGFYHLETIPGGFARWTDGDGHAYLTVPDDQRPGLLTMGLGMVAPVGDVTVRLNGRTLYAGPQWTGPKTMPVPADVAPGPWTFDVSSSIWSAPHDPRALGVYVTGFALSPGAPS